MKLFLRLTTEVNDRLRTIMRYHGELSRCIDEALTSSDLGSIELLPAGGEKAEALPPSSRIPPMPAFVFPRSNAAAPSQRSRTALSNNGSEARMLTSKRAPLRVRTVGLVSSIVAVSAIGLTLLADNGSFGFGGSVTRSERVFLLFIAIAVFIGHVLLQFAPRSLGKRGHGNLSR